MAWIYQLVVVMPLVPVLAEFFISNAGAELAAKTTQVHLYNADIPYAALAVYIGMSNVLTPDKLVATTGVVLS